MRKKQSIISDPDLIGITVLKENHRQENNRAAAERHSRNTGLDPAARTAPHSIYTAFKRYLHSIQTVFTQHLKGIQTAFKQYSNNI